jgi:uracil-DNA glycosylase
MHASWKAVLKAEFVQDYFKTLATYVENERRNYTVHPPAGEVFSAFDLTPFDKVRVVILGQDPYFKPGQAHGLAFSVKHGVTIPPTLANIYRELEADMHVKPPNHGNLTHWAVQGVLLLNTTLTVRTGEVASHFGRGWETFTNAVVRALVDDATSKVFILWGKPARMKKALIPADKHTIIESPHPSPQSAYTGFMGSQPFSKANASLAGYGHSRIDWEIPSISSG